KSTRQFDILFDKTEYTFLHSLYKKDNFLYFVSKIAATDEHPSLYRLDLEAQNNYERLIENVGDDYIVTDNYIYYTSAIEDNGDIFYMHRFDVSTRKSELLLDYECKYLNWGGDCIYYIDYYFDGQSIDSGSGIIKKIDVDTLEVEAVAFPENEWSIGTITNLYYSNNRLYFIASTPMDDSENDYEDVLFELDLQSQTLRFVASCRTLLGDAVGTGLYLWDYIVNEDGILFFIAGADYSIVHLSEEGVVEMIKEYDESIDSKILASKLLYAIDGKPVAYEITNTSDDNIIGAEYLHTVLE
ncbi:MAG: DUF5050 domain-containing protein, partial [Christensenellales bacterium]